MFKHIMLVFTYLLIHCNGTTILHNGSNTIFVRYRIITEFQQRLLSMRQAVKHGELLTYTVFLLTLKKGNPVAMLIAGEETSSLTGTIVSPTSVPYG